MIYFLYSINHGSPSIESLRTLLLRGISGRLSQGHVARPRVVDRGTKTRTKCDRVLPRDAGGMQGMDSLLLLCRVDAFLVRVSGLFMQCVDVFATVRIVTVSARPKACTR